MNTELIERCKLLVKNFETMRLPFGWSGDGLVLAGSSLFAGLNMEADLEKAKECEQIVKNHTSVLSVYRGHSKMPLICKMAVSENPENYFENVDSIVEHMKAFKWIDSDYKVLAAMTICDHVAPNEYETVITKTVDIYQKMKENHPWLTSGEDIPFAAMLAVTDLDIDALIAEMENCYQQLKDVFPGKNALQSLSHILAVDKTETKEKCSKIEKIWSLLKEKDHKFGYGNEISVLGTLSMLDMPVESIVDEIIEADEFLKTQKGFHGIRMGEKERRMYAALMVMDTHVPPASLSQDSLLSSTLAVVIATEICMIMVMTSMCITVSASC